jgi:glycyl-tRNA synthetase beta chain
MIEHQIKSTNEKKIKDALLEIGAEELPASYIEPACVQMKNIATKALSEIGLHYESIETYSTPRRLVLYIKNIQDKTADRQEDIMGPSFKAAIDADGKFTKSAIGFASKFGVKPENLRQKETDKGGYFFFAREVKGEKAHKILADVFSKVIQNISFPKSMVWEESGFKFARPIRNIIALCANKVIKIKVADVASSNWTFGLRSLGNTKIHIQDASQYFLSLKNSCVIVNQDERKQMIRESMKAASANIGSVIEDEQLLDEVVNLVEYPTAVLCEFDKEYLKLPREVLTEVLKKAQKCFTVKDKDGKFTNCFIGIRNGLSNFQEIVRTGYQKVVSARLMDAQFFYQNDLQSGLESNIKKLSGLVFNKDIGTLSEKMERVEKLSLFIWDKFEKEPAKKEKLKKAVWLAKADLVSEMVFEYPQLQGIMGGIYAKALGLESEIYESIPEHYYPLGSGSKLPQNDFAVCISLADKIDSLTAYFAIGLEPTGSADPYALRRAAISVIRIINQSLPALNLSAVIDEAFSNLPEHVKSKAGDEGLKKAKEKLEKFFWSRLEIIFEEGSDGNAFGKEEVKAIVNIAKRSDLINFPDIALKIKALHFARLKDDFKMFTELFKRVNNILEQAKKQNIEIPDKIDESLLNTDSEKALFAVLADAKAKFANLIADKNYEGVFDFAISLKPTIDDFFEKIMVMCDDEKLKKNRIALLAKLRDVFYGFIDFMAL